MNTMTTTIRIIVLVSLAVVSYGLTTCTLPQEPAAQRDHAAEMAMEVASLRSAGYTLGECCEIFGATTDLECERIELFYNAAAPLNN